jgi:hypothetical protein
MKSNAAKQNMLFVYRVTAALTAHGFLDLKQEIQIHQLHLTGSVVAGNFNRRPFDINLGDI